MDNKDKIFLITGGTSGVGNAIAKGIAKSGAGVVIVSRTQAKGESAIKELIEWSGNKNIDYLVADLSLQYSIKKLSEDFKNRYGHLNGLISAAGAIYFHKEQTKEGIDKSFAVNYLSHFSLTRQLLDLLQKTKGSRVLVVGGAPMYLNHPKINFEDLQMQKKYNGMIATSQAMFARIFFTFELAKQLEGTYVSALAFHPGLITSNLIKTAPLWMRILALIFKPFEKKECEIGIYLALKDNLENGVFYDDKKKILPLNNKYDPLLGTKLWAVSEELTRKYFH